MDQFSLETVYRDHRQGMFTLALSITGCRSHAEDAVHDAFSKLTRAGVTGQVANDRFSDGNGKDGNGKTDRKCDFVAYVYSSVRNAAYDVMRRRSRGQRLSETIYNGYVPPAAVDQQNPDQCLLTEERDSAIRKAIKQLPDEYREAIVLKIYSNLSFRQIGEITQLPLKTVATRYRRALVRLNESLKGQL